MPLDLEAEYNNRARVKNSAEIVARWLAASKAARAELPGERDLVYGPKPRNTYDLYRRSDASARAPLVIYIHGGYWQRGAKEEYAFVARELVGHGLTVALPSYTLCPQGTIGDIVEEMRTFIADVWERTKQYPVIVGHSAGGHLAAALMADPRPLGQAPADIVKAGYGISGVYDLPPLIPTSLNAVLGLEDATAKRLSPMFGPKPRHAGAFVAAVGGNESGEFIRQARDFAAAWSASPISIESDVIEGTDHFTIVDELTKSDSRLFKRVVALARQVAA